ncbi:site-specific integrase [uncultured Sneathiella sp.]|uniref:tyrosine-type recombinase/integrase n=1 Tax=uncultured Sneathiella sp. TaxID=879315 RepID=UPI0030EB67E3|tara:strand:- start:1035 stop:1658 length:624 start_codon:yes stop_codon:yes gene_type:complete
MNSLHYSGRRDSISFLYDREGRRKYIGQQERARLLEVIDTLPSSEVRIFCLVLAYTGARLSEILSLTANQIDHDAGVVVIHTLKKRQRYVYRAVPLPPSLLKDLKNISGQKSDGQRLWSWSRTTGWTRIKEIMKAAGISGPQASPKGLRHGFAVYAMLAGVPLTIVSKWLGHSSIKTTAIYTEVVGAEERKFAENIWKSDGLKGASR